MKLYTFFTDVHEGGAHPIKVKWDYGPNSYYLGVNVDMRWFDPRRSFMEALDRLFFFKKAFKGRFVRGNHELNMTDAPDWLVHEGVLMTHGDYLFWGTKHTEAYRAKAHKQSFFRRWLSSFISCKLAEFFQAPITKKFLRRASHCARVTGCHTVVCGHWHPMHVREFEHDGIRIIILPRGRTDLFL